MLEKILIVPDAHIPFEDKKAFACMLKAAKGCDRIVVLGDFLDLMSCSRFDKNPEEQALQFETEILAGNKGLDQLDALGAKHKYYLEGNHEYRLQSLLKRQALSLFSTLSLRGLLRLKARGWVHREYGDHITIGKVSYTHDTGNLGPYAPIRSGAVFESSIVHGHTHYAGLHYFGNAKGETHVAGAMGWLGSKKAAKYLSRIKVSRNWQHGFGWARMEPSGVTHLQFVPIIDGRCVLDGIMVRG